MPNFDTDNEFLVYGSPATATATTYRLTSTDGATSLLVTGTGFTFVGGVPTGGTITSVAHVVTATDEPIFTITNINVGMADVGALLNDITGIRSQITWLAQFDSDGEVVQFSSTQIRLANLDGTFTDLIGSGFSVPPTTLNGTVTAIRHVAANGTTVLGEVNVNETLGVAAGALLEDIASDDLLLLLNTGANTTTGGATITIGDVIYGGGMLDGPGNDTFNGAINGNQHIDFDFATVGGTINLATGIATFGAESNTLVNITGIGGTEFNDTIIGNNLVNRFTGWGGADILQGGGGNDILTGVEGGDALDGGDGSDTANYENSEEESGVYVFFGDTGSATGDAAGDTFVSIENLTGTGLNDILGWDNAANILDGGGGDDVLYGQGGGDTLIGGSGFDTANYSTSSVGLYIYFGDAGGSNGDAAGDTFNSIEAIVGSNFNDVIGMNNGNNMLVGGGGNDTLYGQGGGDRFFGNDGFDTVSYATAGAGVYVYLRDLGHATGDAAGDGDFSSIESIVGSNFNDVLGMGDFGDLLVGGGGNDVLYGLGGGDRFFGNDGFDTVSYAQSGVGLYVFLRDLGHATGEAAGDGDFSSIESLIGSNFNDILGMGDFGDTLIGGGGNDQLWGLGGNDTFYGGSGGDLYIYNGAGFGSDSIMDWQDGADRIDLSRYTGADFGDLALAQEGGGVRVTFGADSILIGGAVLANVTAADFIFGP